MFSANVIYETKNRLSVTDRLGDGGCFIKGLALCHALIEVRAHAGNRVATALLFSGFIINCEQ